MPPRRRARHANEYQVHAVALIASILVACTSATPKVSVSEARETLTEFEDAGLEVPPRNISDILESLEQQTEVSPETVERMRIADADVPASDDVFATILAYYRRADAARRLGRSGQELADLRAALTIHDRRGGEMAFPLSPMFHRSLLRDTAWAEFSDGDYDRALRLFERAALIENSALAAPPKGWMSLAGAAYVHAYYGDLNAALRTRDRALQAMAPHGGPPPWSNLYTANNPWREIYPIAMNYSILQAQGRWAEAEPLIRDGISIYQATIAPRPSNWRHGREFDWIAMQQSELALNLMRQGRIIEAEIIARGALRDSLADRCRYRRNERDWCNFNPLTARLLVLGLEMISLFPDSDVHSAPDYGGYDLRTSRRAKYLQHCCAAHGRESAMVRPFVEDQANRTVWYSPLA